MQKKGSLLGMVFLAAVGCSTPAPPPGVPGGRLEPCPASPNCVSSQSRDQKHFIPPLRYSGSAADAREKLLAVLRELPRLQVRSARADYIHAEQRSRFFRFVDDIEFFFDTERKVIHCRSASRLGYSDLGVNRRRVETIRRRLAERP